jgi:GMP synthase (glutamine-hydrolysing)
MSKAVILQHVEFETPGRLVAAMRDYGIPTEVRHLYRGDEVPAADSELRLLVVMGGPMGVADIPSGQFPFLAAEVDLLKQLIAQDRPVLGICLGAQLLAHAAGAKVYPNAKPGATPNDPVTPMPEIGWGPVTFPFPGGTEPIVFGMHDGAMMFHWHFDTFDLPKLPAPPNAPPPPAPAPPTGNVLLSSTRTCKNQAFRFKNRLIGFQYHFEMMPESIEAMLQHGAADIDKVLGPGGADQVRADTRKYYPAYERLGNRLLNNLIEFLRLAENA